MKRKLKKVKVGDIVVIKEISYEIQEIYEQSIRGNSLHVRFKDTKGKQQEYTSKIDGSKVFPTVFYTDSGVQIFQDTFLTGENTLRDTVLKMLDAEQCTLGIVNIIINIIGDTIWEYDRFDRLKVGDTIVVRGRPHEIEEIYKQDFYDDVDSRKHNLPDKSYVDIEFKDINDSTHWHWNSKDHGGKIIYADGGSKAFSEYDSFSSSFYLGHYMYSDGGKLIKSGGVQMFSEYFLTGDYSLKEAILKMQKDDKIDVRCILIAIIETIGDTVWEG